MKPLLLPRERRICATSTRYFGQNERKRLVVSPKKPPLPSWESWRGRYGSRRVHFNSKVPSKQLTISANSFVVRTTALFLCRLDRSVTEPKFVHKNDIPRYWNSADVSSKCSSVSAAVKRRISNRNIDQLLFAWRTDKRMALPYRVGNGRFPQHKRLFLW